MNETTIIEVVEALVTGLREMAGKLSPLVEAEELPRSERVWQAVVKAVEALDDLNLSLTNLEEYTLPYSDSEYDRPLGITDEDPC